MAKLISTAGQDEAVTPAPRSVNHGFCGDTVTVEFLKTNDTEPRDIFVGVNAYQAVIMRGREVTIPVEVFETIREAKYSDFEDDPDVPGKKVWVDKQRFPYNVISRQSAAAA